MARDLSSNATAGMLAPQTNEIALHLLTITQDSIATLRIVDSREDVISNSETFTAAAFNVVMPKQIGNKQGSVRLVLANVARQFTEIIRSLTGPATVRLDIILAATPDVIEVGPIYFQTTTIQYDVKQIVINAAHENILSEPWPADDFTPQNAPGLF